MKIQKLLESYEVDDLVALLEGQIKPRLSSDVSNYAKGRDRAWLKIEPQLTSRSEDKIHLQEVIPLPLVEKVIWKIFKMIGFNPDTVLCVHGPVGIKPHRDGSYAAQQAAGINLGEVKWFYEEGTSGKPKQIDLPVGAVYTFNCKKLHGAVPVNQNRWAINGWNLAKGRNFIKRPA